MLEITGLILGIMGVVFAFETPRKSFIGLFSSKEKSMEVQRKVAQPVPLSIKTSPSLETTTFGAVQSGRQPLFINKPFTEIGAAIAESKQTNKPLFLVVYNDAHPSKSQLYYSLGCFLDYFTTKKLVNDHFVSALVSADTEEAAKLVPPENPLENCLWVVLSPDGEVLRREGVYANPDEGLKRVRAVVAQRAHA